MAFITKLAAVASLALSVGTVACTVGEEHYEVVKYEVVKAPKEITCESPFKKVEPASLAKKCGTAERGKGHCYDKTKVKLDPEQYADDACDAATEVCVPDKILAANGDKLTSCTFHINGKPGACLSLLAKDLYGNIKSLKQEGCDADERCAPCIDPRNGVDVTGACEPQGVHEEACTGGKSGAKIEICCHGMGQCANLDTVPSDQQSHMHQDTCKKDAQVCIPNAQVNNKPVKCDVFGAAGVCMDVCFVPELAGVQRTTRSSCHPTEVCVPCALGGGAGMKGCE